MWEICWLYWSIFLIGVCIGIEWSKANEKSFQKIDSLIWSIKNQHSVLGAIYPEGSFPEFSFPEFQHSALKHYPPPLPCLICTVSTSRFKPSGFTSRGNTLTIFWPVLPCRSCYHSWCGFLSRHLHKSSEHRSKCKLY